MNSATEKFLYIRRRQKVWSVKLILKASSLKKFVTGYTHAKFNETHSNLEHNKVQAYVSEEKYANSRINTLSAYEYTMFSHAQLLYAKA
jgi:hypothetical protein